ncbi:DNA glycosylase AlkZ-like family protein [Streptomyces chartreusis]|uniref:Winged helix-turn-helix domain-containing protein n=1 Tax=Streptomyces chartreusis TaxID=1969 RepID=A0A7H8T0L8_STRCX|nr:crosslink repair DNA glycosylase YcaQ family protein [Streptomyces chartreusis]QKZ17023.1 winged helix-turn-helix domain-containing protein [Streptomyces chartreusis]
MTVHELSRTDARRIAVRAQLLDATRPDGLPDVVRRLTLLQIDPTAAVAPSADLVAWSRLGASGYAPADLAAALADRRLLELRAMIRPAEDLALYRAEMAEWPERGTPTSWSEYHGTWVAANDACRRDILDRLGAAGPLPSRELPDTCELPWRSSGWSNNRNVTKLLELMVQRGEVAVAGRSGGGRLWDLAERVYPDTPAIPVAEALRTRDERRLRALGIARARGPECQVEPADVGEAGEPAVIEGVRGRWRVDPARLGQPFAGRAALLSPFDRLIHDRRRTTELFGFDYQLEMYKPAAKRRWGYFALPILYGDSLVGKLDATADRRAGVLRVDAIHEDVEFDRAVTEAVGREIEDLARFLGLELVLPR